MQKIGILLITSMVLQGCAPVIFGAAAGATVAVVKDGSIGSAVEDAKIAAKIKKDLMKSGFRELYTKINVEVMKGRVMYTGTVQTEEEAMKAVEIAWEQGGVTEVLNELQVDDKSGYFDTAQFSRDSWITSQIKAKTIMRRDIKFINYTIITSKGVVYLFGSARSDEEMEAVANIAAETKGVIKVISHVNLREQTDESRERK
jgi:osmotically-inducible protein OsmY